MIAARAQAGRDALAQFIAGQGARPWACALPAPLADPLRLIEALPDDADAHFLREADGHASAGWGVAARLEADGPDRFRQLGAQWEALAGTVSSRGATRLRVYGGMAFEAETPGPNWRGFAPASFILPRWCYLRSESGAQLIACGQGAGPSDHLSEWDRIHAALTTPAPPDVSGPSRRATGDRAAFEGAVAQAVAAIGRGELDKVVLSRALRVESQRPPTQVLRRLGPPQRGVCFGFRRAGRWFAGATPELLVRRRGQRVESEAVAGTLRLGTRPVAAGDKDQREHALVVGHIRARLAALGVALEAASAAQAIAHGAIAHLISPIRGQLIGEGPALLGLAEALHPTPALAGAPSEVALRLIAALEDGPRGWYGAPFGYLEPGGEGSLWIGIRSALIEPDSARCFVGAGVVAGSTPAGEWAETEWKAEPMLGALGALA